jgi:hypothetical protein
VAACRRAARSAGGIRLRECVEQRPRPWLDRIYYLRLTEREAAIHRHEFEDVLDDMREDGFSVRPVDEAFERFTQKRAKYGPRLDAIAVMLAAPPGLWIGDRSFLGARTPH